MFKYFIGFSTLFILIFIFQFSSIAQVNVNQLATERLVNPESIETLTPRFSWKLSSDQRNVIQVAYEVVVMQGDKVIWNSGKINSSSSVLNPYEGADLLSGNKYYWKVRVWDNYGKISKWSAISSFRMGLLSSSDWKAQWIEPGYEEDTILRPCPVFKKSFSTSKRVISAMAYITSHGLYEAEINGRRVGNAFLTPGFTSFHKRLQYQAYDVTDLLKKGDNSIQVTLASGWYRGAIGWFGLKNFYGKTLGLLCQLAVTYSDGSKETIISDGSWKCTTGKIVYSEIYNGEIIDNRKDTGNWSDVKVVSYPLDNLVASIAGPVIKQEIFKPVILKTPAGDTVLDFGQNFSGILHFKTSGNAGDSIILEHGEVLDKYGNFYNANLRAAAQKDIFILNGKGEEYFEPHFTFHGFRYARIKGWKGEIKPGQIEAVALYSDMGATGKFECSNPLVNKLQSNIQWSLNGNFVDIPTDCPQRDERLGWTGDAQVFSPTACFNRDVNTFFDKWLRDLSAEQRADGAVTYIVPNVWEDRAGSAGWSDAATIIPWDLYQIYGDKRVLENQYPSMKAWVDYITAHSTGDMWNTGFQYGDRFFFRTIYNDTRVAVTDIYLIAQAYYVHSTQLLVNTAKVLGKTEDVEKYTALFNKVKSAFIREYVTPGGRLMSNTQTAYALALQFDLLPQDIRSLAAKSLVDNISFYFDHISTGFLGTPLISGALSDNGYTDVAYKLLLQDTYPSWLYPVKMGATTIWERWDGIREDSTFQRADNNSLNHYAYGAVGNWLYRTVAGIDMDTSVPAYKKVKIMPHPGGGLKYAKASYESVYGRIAVDWKSNESGFYMDVEIPANTTADVYVPQPDGKSFKKMSVGSGMYHFEELKQAGLTAD